MISPTGIIPERLMRRELKREVRDYLMSLPLAGNLKRRLMEGYALTVGVRVPRRYYQELEATGIEDQAGDVA